MLSKIDVYLGSSCTVPVEMMIGAFEKGDFLSFVKQHLCTAVVHSYAKSVLEGQISFGLSSWQQRSVLPIPDQMARNARDQCKQGIIATCSLNPIVGALHEGNNLIGMRSERDPATRDLYVNNVKPFNVQQAQTVIAPTVCLGVNNVKPFNVQQAQTVLAPTVCLGVPVQPWPTAETRFGNAGDGTCLNTLSRDLANNKQFCFGMENAVQALVPSYEQSLPDIDEPPPPGVEDFTYKPINFIFEGRIQTHISQPTAGSRKLNNPLIPLGNSETTLKLNKSSQFKNNSGHLSLVQSELLVAVKKNYSKRVLDALISEELGCWLAATKDRNKLLAQEKHNLSNRSSCLSTVEDTPRNEGCTQPQLNLSALQMSYSGSCHGSITEIISSSEQDASIKDNSLNNPTSQSKILPFILKAQEMLRDLERSESCAVNDRISMSFSSGSCFEDSVKEGMSDSGEEVYRHVLEDNIQVETVFEHEHEKPQVIENKGT